MENEINWTTGDGRNAAVTVELIDRGLGRCKLVITATANGAVMGYGEPMMTNHPVAVARIGNLGMTQTNLDRVNAAIAACKETPQWVAKLNLEKELDKADRDYDEIVKAMSR